MKTKILNILSILLGLMLVNGGLDKFLHYMPMPENLPDELIKDMVALAEITWLMPLIGFAEIIGGLFIIIKKTRVLGILVVFPVMVGALLTHIFVAPSGLPILLIIWAILVWNIIEYKTTYLSLLK
ncbi:MAG: DoxX family protein [Flavobacteriales bacterium CG_4_9_14_0_2_um_filter_32_27]|nr:MAG: DoxX family protein [Flavobacteriales bacterium CG_4_9_14_0_2_um_filter_32_27]